MERYEKKKRDVSFFDKAVQNVRVRDDAECTMLIENFNKSKRAAINLFAEDDTDKAVFVRRLQEELDIVCDELMSIEMRQVLCVRQSSKEQERSATQCSTLI